jgi:hypothetical protein
MARNDASRCETPHAPRSVDFLRSLGRWIDVLGGRYLAAEDVGASQRDMDGIARETAWVTGVDPGRGVPATRPGHGVRRCTACAGCARRARRAGAGVPCGRGPCRLPSRLSSTPVHAHQLAADAMCAAVAGVPGSTGCAMTAECDAPAVPRGVLPSVGVPSCAPLSHAALRITNSRRGGRRRTRGTRIVYA